jgi:hypothetical protein
MSGMRRSLTLALVLAIGTSACSSSRLASPEGRSPAPTSVTSASAVPTGSPGAGETVRIPLSGAAPDALVLDGGTAWVLTGEGGKLLQVDLAARREVGAIEVGFGATHLVLLDGAGAAVARFDDGGTGTFLPIVDLETGTVNGVATGALGGLARGESGIVWALEKAGRLLQVDTAARSVRGDVAVAIGTNVHTEVEWGAGSAWVGSDGTPVVRVRGSDLAIEATIPVDTGLPLLVEDGMVWGAGPEQVWAIDPATNSVARRVPLDGVIEVLAMDVADEDAWLAVRRTGHVGAVLHVDLARGAIASEVAVSLPAAVRIAPDRVWVASYLTNELLGYRR